MINNQGHYAIRMDGALYVCRGDKIEEVEDLTNIRGNRLFVSDLDGAYRNGAEYLQDKWFKNRS